MGEKIYLNLKRFDISKELGGVNSDLDVLNWAANIIEKIELSLVDLAKKYDVEFVVYLPEAHLIKAIEKRNHSNIIQIGCQGVLREDVSSGGNFGAFTTGRTAKSMKQLGVSHTIIGHFEERKYLSQIFEKVTQKYSFELNNILNEEIHRAIEAQINVLYCIGETFEQRDHWQEVLKMQLEVGLKGVDTSKIVIGYEPIWAIGPGKTPPNAEEIKEVVTFIKSIVPEVPVIYGGGLKNENAKEIANIDNLNGGLIALTRFSGEIGFYPAEYIEIINTYFS